MKILALGTGNIITKYNSSSFLIDNQILIDMPNGTCKTLKKSGFNPENINHVLFTHFHGDHYFDMPFYFLNLTRLKELKDIYLYTDRKGIKKIKKIFKLAFPQSNINKFENTHLHYETTLKFTINTYNITKILVDHGNFKPAYGYIFNDRHHNIGFTGDSCLCPAILTMAKTCHYLFCDCSYLTGTSKHMGLDNITSLTKNYPDCTFITTHMSDEVRLSLKSLNLTNLIVPEDNQEFTI